MSANWPYVCQDMSYLNPAIRAELQARLATKEEQLEAAEAELLEAITKPEEYRFNSGDGNQWVRSRSLPALRKLIQELERDIDLINRKLRGGGLTSIELRRRGR